MLLPGACFFTRDHANMRTYELANILRTFSNNTNMRTYEHVHVLCANIRTCERFSNIFEQKLRSRLRLNSKKTKKRSICPNFSKTLPKPVRPLILQACSPHPFGITMQIRRLKIFKFKRRIYIVIPKGCGRNAWRINGRTGFGSVLKKIWSV